VFIIKVKRDLNRRLTDECRCDERLEVETEGSTPVSHIHWVARGTGTPKDRDEKSSIPFSVFACERVREKKTENSKNKKDG
jgi:hypothetical protein